MPAAGAIIAAVSTLGQAAAAGFSLAASLAITAAVVGLNVLGSVLTKQSQKQSTTNLDKNRTVTIKQSIMKRDFIYGQVRVGGKLAYATEVDDKYLHMVYLLATHEVDEINGVYINDYLVTDDMLDSSGNVMRGLYKDKLRIKKHVGTDAQTADSDLVSEVTEITSTDTFSGIAYVYCRYQFDTSIYPTGIPTFSADVKGKKLYDFRDTNTKYSENPALAIYDYLTNTRYGKSEASGRIDTSSTFTSVANTCEEFVTVKDVTHDVTPISNNTYPVIVNEGASTLEFKNKQEIYDFPFETADAVTLQNIGSGTPNTSTTYYIIIVDENTVKLATSGANAIAGTAITFSGASTQNVTIKVATDIPVFPTSNIIQLDDETSRFATGDRVQCSTTGTLPSGLSLSTNYYVIMVGSRIKPRMKLATSAANAYAGTAIDITDRGAGTMTITKNAEPRYTANGVFTTDQPPYEILEEMTKALGGFISYVGGKWFLKGGVYASATVTFSEDDIMETLTVPTRQPGRSRYNAVQGTHYSPFHNDQAVDFPPIAPSSYLSADNDVEKFTTIDFPLTNRSQTCQRLAYLFLNKHRLQIQCQFVTGLKGLRVKVGDTVQMTLDRYGWSSKEFEVVEWELVVGSQGDTPVYKVRLGLQETSSAVYSFNHSTDETIPAAPAGTNLDSAFAVVDEPTGLTISSGTNDLFVAGDGTVVSRIKVSWDDPSSSNSFIAGHEVEWKLDSDSTYTNLYIPMPAVFMHIQPVNDGDTYDIRIRAVNQINKKSDYVEADPETVVGKSDPPSNVPTLTVSQNGTAVLFRWGKVTDVDLGGYEIRYGLQTQSWADMTTLTFATKGTQVTTVAVPPGTWKFCIKAIDTSGNESTTSLCQNLTISNAQTTIYQANTNNAWLGALPNYPYFLPTGSDTYFEDNDASAKFINDPDTATTAGEFSVRLAFNSGSNTTYNRYIADSGGSSRTGIRVYVDDSDVVVAVYTNTFGRYSTSFSKSENTDYDIAIIMSSSGLYVYDLAAGGVELANDVTAVAASMAQYAYFRIGQPANKASTNNVFNAGIYLFAVWDGAKEYRELTTIGTDGTYYTTAAEMVKIDNDGLKHHIAFDTPGQTTLVDYGEDKLNLVANSTAQVTDTERQSYVNVFGTQNLVRNPVKGWLQPDDTTSASADDDDVFDNYVQQPYYENIYKEPEIDLGMSGNIRVYADAEYELVPGETEQPVIDNAIDYIDSSLGYDGYENWAIGYITARYFKFRQFLDGRSWNGLAYLTKYIPSFDAELRTESDTDVTVAVSGTAITFTTQFYNTPNVQVTMAETGGKTPAVSSVSTTGFTITVYNSSGTDVGGVVNWTAEGT